MYKCPACGFVVEDGIDKHARECIAIEAQEERIEQLYKLSDESGVSVRVLESLIA